MYDPDRPIGNCQRCGFTGLLLYRQPSKPLAMQDIWSPQPTNIPMSTFTILTVCPTCAFTNPFEDEQNQMILEENKDAR